MSGVERIGNREREAAVAALRLHVGAGRITSAEYEDRTVTAREARTWAELDPLFTDLPSPGPAEIRADAEREELRPVAGTGGVEHRNPIGEPAIPEPQRAGWVPEPYGYTITALAPIAAVILFFVTGSWLWFLAIPVVGILVYGPDGAHGNGHQGHDRGRQRRRGGCG